MIVISLIISLINLVLCLVINKLNNIPLIEKYKNNLLISTLSVFIISLVYFELK